MKKLRFILLFVVVLLAQGRATAYDFESGGLYYNTLDAEAKTVEVTARDYQEWSTKADYVGDIVVPATVENGGITYIVKQIGRCAFKSSEITSLTLSEGIEVIDQDICEGCYQLASLSLPSTLKSIGYAAFWNCYNLRDVELPEGLQTLGNNVFAYASNLKRIVLPSTLTSIGSGIFIGGSSLELVISRLQVPIEVQNGAFASKSSWDESKQQNIYTPPTAILYVPSGTKTSYLSAAEWSTFNQIFEGEPMEGTGADGLRYSYAFGEKVAMVIAGDYSSLENVTIPSSVIIDGDTYSVKAVAPAAFRNCYNLRSLIIENGIESIGNYAFNNIGIRSLVIPEGVTSIGNQAFANCNSLTKVELPSTLKSIDDWAFGWCGSLSAVVSHIQTPFEIQQSVFALRSDGSYNDNGQWITTYTPSSATLYVPEGTKGAYEAFAGWNMFAGIVEGDLKEATIDGLTFTYMPGKGVATLIAGDYSSLTNVTIPGSITVDGNSYTVKEIAARAFYQCTNLDSLVIAEGVETIGDEAFYWTYCQLVVLPSTLKSIGARAFYHLSNQAVVKSRIKEPFSININTFAYGSYLENGREVYTHLDGTLHVPVGSVEKYEALAGWKVIGEIMEGEPKEGEGNDGFRYSYIVETKKATLIQGDGYYSVTDLTVPSTTVIDGATYDVIGIGERAFTDTYVRTVIIPEGVKTIGDAAFHNCSSLRKVTLPESIIKIGEQAFEYCRELDTISIPSKVEYIGNWAFADTKIKEIAIPAATSYIGQSAFRGCREVTIIRVDAKNSYFDSRSNSNALIETATNKLIKGLATTVIPNSVVEIGVEAFNGVSGLTGITIPNSVTTIRSSAFSDCDNLTSIFIPSSVTLIEGNPFVNCDALTSIKVDQNNTVYDSHGDCNAIIQKAQKMLVTGCKNTVIPRDVKIIGNLAFYSVNGLDSLKIPYGVQEIQDHAFSYCNGLRYVEIPNSVKNIGWYALGGNRELATLVSKIKNPANVDINYGAFYDSSIQSNAILYVPKGLKDTYMEASVWSDFRSIVEMSGEQLAAPVLTYDGRYVTATSADKDVDMYYGIGGAEPTEYYDGPISVSDLGTVKVIAEKSFFTDSEPATLEVEYLYNGDTLKLAKAGLMAEAIKWEGSDKIEKMTVVGPISSDEFSTIQTLSNLRFLNLAAAEVDGASLPDGAFANSQLVSFVSPSTLSSVGSGIFRDCQQLAAVCWNASTALPSDALSGVTNPNLLLYVKSAEQAPAGINNVIVDGTAKSITLTDAAGNSNFYVPVAFTVTDTIKYTRNFQQKTVVGESRGWETIVLPFTVSKISHERLTTTEEMVPFVRYNGNSSQRPFWLYTLEENNVFAASQIEANKPYLICMPNADEYGDQYNLAGNVTFKAWENVSVGVSKPIEQTQGDISFVPTYQRVAASSDVFALNVNQEYKGYPAGSLFVNNFREVRPFEAYSVHPSVAAVAQQMAARFITVASLIGGGDTTGIVDVMLKKNEHGEAETDGIIKVYSLSGALINQGKAEEVTKTLPKGIYIANGKKFVVK